MGMGFLKVEATAGSGAIPVANAKIAVRDEADRLLYRMVTDEDGRSEIIALEAPDLSHTLSPDDPGPWYSRYTVEVTANGFETVIVEGVQLFDTETSILPVEMRPQLRGGLAPLQNTITIPENSLHMPTVRQQQEAPEPSPALRRSVIIPDYITVHLGSPSSNARNIRVPFSDYIKNVASSEIYPTWPVAALEANIHCQISYALNRVYTEWYPSRGYSFHITNSTAYDQYFVEGRNIYANISQIVDSIFNVFVRRQGYAEPYFTQYCNGTSVTCNGLSQWGTVALANQGLTPYQILLRYYPNDIQLVQSNQIGGIVESYPGTPLRQGSTGEAVRDMQVYLNRIRINYPLIPQISNPNGVFDADTAQSVRTFQRVFSLAVDGIVGKATWYKIIQLYTGIKKLADLESEGERLGIGATPPTSLIRQGSSGRDVVQLQHILNFISEFYNDIPPVLENSAFDSITRQSVVAFQQKMGLSADGIVGPATWQVLYDVYNQLDNTASGGNTYPGTLLRVGSRGESVRAMQYSLNKIFSGCAMYRPLAEDGIFGNATDSAVRSFQQMSGLAVDGLIGPATWNAIVNAAA